MYFELKTRSIGGMTDDQFFAFCQENRDLHFERNANGQIIFIMPTGGRTGYYNTQIITDLNIWNRITKRGVVFDSSTGFRLPNTATRSPDASWVSREKWDALTEEEKSKFPPLCPDFVVELASESDTAAGLKDKMEEYKVNGCRLGWLIAPAERKVWIYRSDQPVQEVTSFAGKLSGEEVLPGFELDLQVLQ